MSHQTSHEVLGLYVVCNVTNKFENSRCNNKDFIGEKPSPKHLIRTTPYIFWFFDLEILQTLLDICHYYFTPLFLKYLSHINLSVSVQETVRSFHQ